jgi:hypothetical protein
MVEDLEGSQRDEQEARLSEWEARRAAEKAARAAQLQADKELLLDRLASLGVARAEVEYSGAGDEGCVEDSCYFDAAGNPVQLSKDDALDVEEFVDDSLAHKWGGWGNNEGAYGTATVDVAGGRVRFDHQWRVYSSEPDPFEV